MWSISIISENIIICVWDPSPLFYIIVTCNIDVGKIILLNEYGRPLWLLLLLLLLFRHFICIVINARTGKQKKKKEGQMTRERAWNKSQNDSPEACSLSLRSSSLCKYIICIVYTYIFLVTCPRKGGFEITKLKTDFTKKKIYIYV